MSDGSKINVTFAICTHNRAEYVRDAVISLRDACGPLACTWEIVVVDNASTDGTETMLADIQADGSPIVVEEETLGLSHARNRAIQEARGEFIVFLDDDVIVPPTYASVLMSFIESDKCDVFGGPLLPKWEADPPKWMGKDLYGYLGLLEEEVGADKQGFPRIVGANMGFRRSVLTDLGQRPFDPELGRKGTKLLGGEESFLVGRLSRNGARVSFCPRAYIYHRIPSSRLSLRYFLRWTYYGGVSDCREATLGSGKTRLPRWVVGELVTRGIKAPLLMAIGKRRASVRAMLGFSRRLGRVVEYARTKYNS